MQKKINFNVPVKGLDGKVVSDENGEITLGKLFAPIIAGQSKGDALKLLSWAMAMYKNEDLMLDKSDIAVMKNLINEAQQITIMVKAPLLELLDKEDK